MSESKKGRAMDLERFSAKTPVTLDEIKWRVSNALRRHPMCRNVKFDIIPVPRTSTGRNWTATLQSVESGAIWEASDIVSDIQAAYELSAAA